jgi:hypothetical protein
MQRSLIEQAGALPVSQPPTPGAGPLSVMVSNLPNPPKFKRGHRQFKRDHPSPAVMEGASTLFKIEPRIAALRKDWIAMKAN